MPIDVRLQKHVIDSLERLRDALEYADSWEAYRYSLGRLHGATELWKLIAEKEGE